MKASLLANAELQQDAALAGEIDRLDRERKVPSDLKGRMETAMRKAIEAINTMEFMQAAQGSRLGFPLTKDNGENRPKLNTPRFKFDELHFRAVLAALTTRDGPARLADFTQRMILLFQEDIPQDR